jgi:hypothetical protein
MTTSALPTSTLTTPTLTMPWMVAVQGAAALAASTGIARFVYTPILPLMTEDAGLSAAHGADLATANYIGYLLGALVGIFAPRIVRSPLAMRIAMGVMIVALALMPAWQNIIWWEALRLATGGASALVFIYATSAMLSQLRGSAPQLVGWGFGGIGAGIALSGLLVLGIRNVSSWEAAWLLAALLTAGLTAAAWGLRHEGPSAATSAAPARPRATRRWFTALSASYTLEGVGYIIAGTFLVAAVAQSGPGWLGDSAWIVVGLAAIPGSALWAALARRWSRPTLLASALIVQAIGLALAGLFPGAASALISAALFGGTFVGISSLALALGTHLQLPRAVAMLTTGYGIGQIVGPLISRPLLSDGYSLPLLLGAVVIAAAASVGALVRIRFPHRLGDLVEPSRAARDRRAR